ncbi:MAG TPA: F0F1 ATP synthase subunit A [Lacipirellulaceae bacterium]|nr:F0F1 ATP synthase subunit A [Lacipirellulaceae bacterium]
MAEHKTDPLAPTEIFKHVEDATYFHVPRKLAPASHGHIEIPQPFEGREPLFVAHTGNPVADRIIQPLDLKITKFMVIELAVAILMCLFFIALAKSIRGGRLPRGRFGNMLEAMLLFFRDNIARPYIGGHDADRFVPFLWTLFFFLLGCNLFGMIPWMGTPTSALATTATLAFITFIVVIGAGMKKLGPAGFWKAQVPHLDLSLEIGGINFEPVLKIFLIPMIFAIEVLGLIIKHCVLAVRLLANMMAGHVVLAVILAFIAASAQSLMWWAVMPASVFGATALSMLELFVAFLHAYIFTFLAALFIGMAVHPH